MTAAGEPSSESAPVRYRDDCQKTVKMIKDKAKTAGRWYVPFPKGQSGTLGREIRLEYDTGIALVCTSGKRPTEGIDLATRGIPEALADMAANEGVTGGVVLYDCMFRFQKMTEERVLERRAARVAARRAGTGDDGEDTKRGAAPGRRNSRREKEEPRARPSKQQHRDAQGGRPGEAKAAEESHRPQDPAPHSRPGEGLVDIEDINRFRRERNNGEAARQPRHDNAYYNQEEMGIRGERRDRGGRANRGGEPSAEDVAREMGDFARHIRNMIRYGQIPQDPRDPNRQSSRNASTRDPNRHRSHRRRDE